MARKIHRLKSTQITNAKPGLHPDGGNLYLQVTDNKSKSWLFRYAKDGRERQMGLGSLNDVPLPEARDEATRYRRVLRDGLDPIEVRNSERADRALSNVPFKTFKQLAEDYIRTHSVAWKNEKHLGQWKTSLEQHVYPILGNLPARSITSAHVLSVLKPIWNTIPETASRVRGRIELVMDDAKAQGQFRGDNPAAWKGNLKPQLPARSKVRKVVHHAALPYERAGEFVATLRADDNVSSEAMEIVVLCASRLSEVSGMRGREIDLQAKMWTIPGERMKGGIEHRVPLSERALEIIRKRLRGDDDLVFPGWKGKRLTDAAFKQCRQRVGYGAFTTHGMRSTFKTWASEQTNFPNEVSEAALAHTIEDKVERAYNRTTFFEKRRELMKAWAEYCDRLPADTTRVIPIRAAV